MSGIVRSCRLALVLSSLIASSLAAQEPFLSYDFTDEDTSDFFAPMTNDLCGEPLSITSVAADDGELLITNDEFSGFGMVMLRPEIVADIFPESRNYSVRLRFNMVDNLELAIYLKARWGNDGDAGTSDSQLERGYAFTVFTEGIIPNFPQGTLAVAEWTACHEIVEHNTWPDGTFGAGWVDPGFNVLPSEWYWLELSVQGNDDGGPVILTGKIWEDGEDEPEAPQLVVTDPNGLNHTEATRAPENDVQMFIGTGFDLDLNFPLAMTLLDDISFTEIEVECAGGLTCTVNQEAAEVTLNWSAGEGFRGTLELSRDGEVIATPGPGIEELKDSPGDGVHVYSLVVTPADGAGQDQCAGTFTCRAIIASGALFFDDFNSYANDDDLIAAGWEPIDVNDPVEDATFTVTNPGSRSNPPTRDGTPTFGRFLVSDSDAASGSNPTGSGMSHDVWSPAFSCAGVDTVWMHADVFIELNNNGVCVFDVDVSTDDGDTWENVFRRVAPARTADEPVVTFENADNIFGPLDINISRLAANERSVRIRFRDFEPNDDWWMAIDNVLVDSSPVEGGNVVLLATESFDNEISAEWLLDTLGDAPWDVEDLCGHSLPNSKNPEFPDGTDGRSLHHLDESFALVSSFCSGFEEDEFLITPPVDCSRVTRVFLHFESDVLIDDGGPSVEEVLLSLDGGESFEAAPIFSYKAGGGGYEDLEVYYNAFILEVPRAVGESEVAFAFHYSAPGGVPSFWAVDNVQITGEGEAGTRFKRGDADARGAIDITDGIFILNFLFLGGATPACLDAADIDDSGMINITDGINVLNFLFLGGLPPRAPFRECGLDPTEDDLGCELFPPCDM